MMPKPQLIDISPAKFDEFPCCGIKSNTHPGRCAKKGWLEANFKFGLRARVLVDDDSGPCAYIEYLPGEYAWRGVNARGYMLIHCLWNHSKRSQGKGLGSAMVQACVEDAKQADMNGVVVLTRKGPWLADRRLYEANGFELADTAPPDYELLVRKLKRNAANPVFKGDWERKMARYNRGLTIIRSGQCPYVAKFSAEIAETAEQEYGIKAKVVDLKSWQDAQDAPTPYAVFALIYEGRLLADHQISGTRFRNIMRKCLGTGPVAARARLS